MPEDPTKNPKSEKTTQDEKPVENLPPKKKKKLSLDTTDISEVLERKIAP